MNVNILGNGPSRSLWAGGGISIGCNCANDTDLVVFADKWLVYKIFDRELRPKVPVILGPAAYDESRNVNIKRKCMIIGHIGSQGFSLNAGQTAAIWAFLVYPGARLNLFGFDSLWSGERTSETDVAWADWKTGKPARNDGKSPAPKKWGDSWREIKKKFPAISLAVHAPAGVKVNALDGLFELVEH